jgi:glutathione S-transferase
MKGQSAPPCIPGSEPLTLVSHALCPYVQRAVIVALENGIRFERVVIDLADKPAWFVDRSPTGKVPLLMIGETTLFESAAISEFLDEISGGGLLPSDPVQRARHRAWIEFASGTLSEIAGLYSAPDAPAFGARRAALIVRFRRLEEEVAGPWFGGEEFGLVDAAFAPAFRYLDAFERHAAVFLAEGSPKISRWRHLLTARISVRTAVVPDYPERLRAFLRARGSHLSGLMTSRANAELHSRINAPGTSTRAGPQIAGFAREGAD